MGDRTATDETIIASSTFSQLSSHCILSTNSTIITFSLSPNLFHLSTPVNHQSFHPQSLSCKSCITKWSMSSTSPFPHCLHILSSLLTPCDLPSHLDFQFRCSTSQPGHPPMPLAVYPYTPSFAFYNSHMGPPQNAQCSITVLYTILCI